MIINIVDRGLTEVTKVAGIEHFVVVKTGEVLHLVKDRGMDLWHVVSVVVPAKVEAEVKNIEETVKDEIAKITGKVEAPVKAAETKVEADAAKVKSTAKKVESDL